MDIKKYYEYTEDFFGDKTEAYYINGLRNDYRVTLTTMGAYDENGNETIANGAHISIDEITGNNETVLNTIKALLEKTCEDVKIGYEATYNSCIKVLGYVSGYDWNSPDSTENTLKAVIEKLVEIA